ncbi:hypothetical protein ACWDE0_33955 [Streptomyces sp. 900105755]|uniref:hypothetical protein n=1 Tax=unclassified Streptomyces TaxID=2593676 RepID=UPI000898EACB|nr:hypothetical protein [Streptomyces sp. Ag109_O5-10]SEF02219.1 hypothetical protein SAMN05216533_5258 [Streptomyces sp. Ag109_O5-10]
MPDAVAHGPTDGGLAPPTDYGLVVPDGWFRIPLEPDGWKGPIKALAERVFEGQDDAVLLKREFSKALLARAEEGYENGGVELYISTTSIGPVPLSSSLLVTVVPPDQGFRLDAQGRSQQVTAVELPFAGPATTRRTRTVPEADDSSGSRLPVTVVDYAVGVPGTEAVLLLTFSTPLDMFADAMVELFEAVAKSLHWR